MGYELSPEKALPSIQKPPMKGLYSQLIDDFLEGTAQVAHVKILEPGHRSRKAIYQGLKDQIVVKGLTTIDVCSRGPDVFLYKKPGLTVRA